MDERQELSALPDQQPENPRPGAALWQLENQLVSNLCSLGFTPSDRSRSGLVQVKAYSKLDELTERRAPRAFPQGRTLTVWNLPVIVIGKSITVGSEQ